MTQNREYQGHAVGHASCTYSQMKHLSAGNAGQLSTPGHYVVPKYCPSGDGAHYPPRHDTLSHGQSYMCGGYFNMKSAYPLAGCNSCKLSYTTRPCTGPISCSDPVPVEPAPMPVEPTPMPVEPVPLPPMPVEPVPLPPVNDVVERYKKRRTSKMYFTKPTLREKYMQRRK